MKTLNFFPAPLLVTAGPGVQLAVKLGRTFTREGCPKDYLFLLLPEAMMLIF